MALTARRQRHQGLIDTLPPRLSKKKQLEYALRLPKIRRKLRATRLADLSTEGGKKTSRRKLANFCGSIGPDSESNPRIKLALSPEEDWPAVWAIFKFSGSITAASSPRRFNFRLGFALKLLSIRNLHPA
jgi:hypothetical protein